MHSFRTGPKDGCSPFRFIASGDHRSDDDFGPNPKWESILGEMEATGATFVVETGDLVKDGEDLKQWANHMDLGAMHMGELALRPSFGNHDSDDVQGVSAAFNQLFSLPTNDKTATEDFYAFDYGNAVFGADTKGSGVPSDPTGGTTASSGESSGGCSAGGGPSGHGALSGLLLLLLGVGAGLRRLRN